MTTKYPVNNIIFDYSFPDDINVSWMKETKNHYFVDVVDVGDCNSKLL